MSTKSNLSEMVKRYESEILKDWIKEQLAAVTQRADLISEAERRYLNARVIEVLSKESTSRETAVARIRDAIRRLNDE